MAYWRHPLKPNLVSLEYYQTNKPVVVVKNEVKRGRKLRLVVRSESTKAVRLPSLSPKI